MWVWLLWKSKRHIYLVDNAAHERPKILNLGANHKKYCNVSHVRARAREPHLLAKLQVVVVRDLQSLGQVCGPSAMLPGHSFQFSQLPGGALLGMLQLALRLHLRFARHAQVMLQPTARQVLPRRLLPLCLQLLVGATERLGKLLLFLFVVEQRAFCVQ